MDFWNKIVNFFTNTVPAFAQEQWLIIELALFGLVFLFIIILIVVSASKKKQKKNSDTEIMSLVAKHSTKAKELEEKEKKYNELNKTYTDALTDYKALEEVSVKEKELIKAEYEDKLARSESDLTSCKELLADREMNLSALRQECQEKDTKIANMTIEKDNLQEKYEASTNEVTSLKLDVDALNATITKADNDYKLLKEKHSLLESDNTETKAELTNLSTTYELLLAKHNKLEAEHKEVLAENDVLRNFEVENDVLLKTLRKFREDEQVSKNEAKDAIVALEDRLTQKIENTFATLTAKVASESVKKVISKDEDETSVETMKRAELSEIAKKLGIKNFATWSNEKLRAEIKNLI